MTTSSSTARLEARISPDLHAMLKRVAELQGRTMTDFVVAALQEAHIEPSNSPKSSGSRWPIRSAFPRP